MATLLGVFVLSYYLGHRFSTSKVMSAWILYVSDHGKEEAISSNKENSRGDLNNYPSSRQNDAFYNAMQIK